MSKWIHAMPTKEGWYWLNKKGHKNQRYAEIVYISRSKYTRRGLWDIASAGDDCPCGLSQERFDNDPDMKIAGPLKPPE